MDRFVRKIPSHNGMANRHPAGEYTGYCAKLTNSNDPRTLSFELRKGRPFSEDRGNHSQTTH